MKNRNNRLAAVPLISWRPNSRVILHAFGLHHPSCPVQPVSQTRPPIARERLTPVRIIDDDDCVRLGKRVLLCDTVCDEPESGTGSHPLVSPCRCRSEATARRIVTGRPPAGVR